MLRLLSKNGLVSRIQLVRTLSLTPQNDKKIQFFLSDIGEGTKEVVIKGTFWKLEFFEKMLLEWFVTEGQEIEEFDELVEVQSDKATVPITSRYSGKVVKLHYDLEDVALVGQPLVDLEVEDDGDAEPVDHYEQSKFIWNFKSSYFYSEKEEPKATKKTVSNSVAKDGKVKAKPAVRKFAKDNGVNINEVTATGPKGTVTKEDVEAFMNQGAAQPTVAQTPPPVAQQAPPAAAAPVKGTIFAQRSDFYKDVQNYLNVPLQLLVASIVLPLDQLPRPWQSLWIWPIRFLISATKVCLSFKAFES